MSCSTVLPKVGGGLWLMFIVLSIFFCIFQFFHHSKCLLVYSPFLLQSINLWRCLAMPMSFLKMMQKQAKPQTWGKKIITSFIWTLFLNFCHWVQPKNRKRPICQDEYIAFINADLFSSSKLLKAKGRIWLPNFEIFPIQQRNFCQPL